MKIIVVGRNAQGEPEFHTCDVEAGQEAIDNGDHYDLAIENAEHNGYGGPFLAFDENDQAAKQLPELAEWMCGKPTSAPATYPDQRKLSKVFSTMLQMENELHSLRKHADDLAQYKLQKGASHDLEMLIRKAKELEGNVQYIRGILNG